MWDLQTNLSFLWETESSLWHCDKDLKRLNVPPVQLQLYGLSGRRKKMRNDQQLTLSWVSTPFLLLPSSLQEELCLQMCKAITATLFLCVSLSRLFMSFTSISNYHSLSLSLSLSVLFYLSLSLLFFPCLSLSLSLLVYLCISLCFFSLFLFRLY